jgi:hypothetical protein
MPNFNWLKCFVAAATLGLLATSAFGETINLVCKGDTGQPPFLKGRVTLDTNANTAIFTNWVDHSDPIASASFTDTTVKWNISETANGSLIQKWYSLDRDTGALNEDGSTSGRSNGPIMGRYICTIARRQF